MYESPINRICGEIYNEIIRKDEEHLMTTITQQVGYQVDKDELLKALQYDRDQYRKGYNDALNEVRKKVVGLTYYWCEVNPTRVKEDVLEIIDRCKAESEDRYGISNKNN